MVLKLLPSDVARMSIKQHDWPVLTFDLASASFDAGFFPRQSLAAGLGSSVDIGSRITRIMQQGEHSSTAQRFPYQLGFVRPLPEAIRKTKLMDAKMFDHRE